jgi:hypothetical protein
MSNKKGENYRLMKTLEQKLNGELGDAWWNLYVAGAFWSNISTPINLSITLLSAVTAGQATTTNMLSQDLFIKVSIASLIISTLNTFFRPHSQLMTIMDSLKKINELGFEFENTYYTSCDEEEHYKKRYSEYKNILMKLNKFQQSQSPDQQNFFTDFIYWFFKKYSCLRKSYKWLDLDMEYIGDQENNSKTNEPEGCCGCNPCSPCCIKKNLNPNTDTNSNTALALNLKQVNQSNQSNQCSQSSVGGILSNLTLTIKEIDSKEGVDIEKIQPKKIVISDEENQLSSGMDKSD